MSDQHDAGDELPRYPVHDAGAETGSGDEPSAAPPATGPRGLDRAQRTNRYAVGALVCGLASLPMVLLAGMGLPVGVGAVVLAVIGLRQIKESQGQQGGTGLAVAGLVLGGLGTLLGVVGMVIAAVQLARM